MAPMALTAPARSRSRISRDSRAACRQRLAISALAALEGLARSVVHTRGRIGTGHVRLADRAGAVVCRVAHHRVGTQRHLTLRQVHAVGTATWLAGVARTVRCTVRA